MKKQKVVVIVGPTSSGKSALAVELARRFNGEVVSADSRQVYRDLNIGTGKITKREMRGIPHHLLDIASSKRVFTAHDFLESGTRAIESVLKHGKLPILAGGTGFYIDALLGRITLPNVPVNPRLRERLRKKTAEQLFTLLKKKDPRRARNINPNNTHRLVRALEIAHALGHVPHTAHNDIVSRYDVLWIGITPPREELHKKIHVRLLSRMRQGMVSEARRLHTRGLSYKRMEGLGLEYRWLARFLQKKIDRKEMLLELERDIRHYAKRQMTYWRRNKEIRWFAPTKKQKAVLLIRRRIGK